MPANVILKPREFLLALLSTAVGGFVGTLLRDLATGAEHLPSTSIANVTWPQEIPWVLLAINFFGVLFVTRLLRGRLRHHDPNNLTRLLIVTGFFGGLTSYSGLFIDLAAIWHVSVAGCLVVTLCAVGSGVLAGWLGLMRHHR